MSGPNFKQIQLHLSNAEIVYSGIPGLAHDLVSTFWPVPVAVEMRLGW